MTQRMGPIAAISLFVSVVAIGSSRGQEAELIERGQLIYRIHCVNCHGENGKGNGPLAKVMKIQPTDLTGITRRNGGRFPFDEIYRVIDGRDDVAGHGTRKMPIWGLSFQDPGSDVNQEDQVRGRILQLIRYLRSIQDQPESPAEPDTPDPGNQPAR